MKIIGGKKSHKKLKDQNSIEFHHLTKDQYKILTQRENADSLHSHYFPSVRGSGGISDHGQLIGLEDDDHEQYWIGDGSRASDVLYFNPAVTPPEHEEGKTYWSDDFKSLLINTNIPGADVVAGHNMIKRIANRTGDTLTKGQVVYISGAQGNRPTVELADADTEATSASTIGLIYADIEDQDDGLIITIGTLKNIDTSAWEVGDVLWLSQTAGDMTDTIPSSPAHAVRIGIVTVDSAESGEVEIGIDNGFELFELHDVDGSLFSPTDEDILQWDDAAKLWKGETPDSVAGTMNHDALLGLADDDHSQYLLLAGRSGGQVAIGGTASGNNLTLQSTAHATKGKILFGALGNSVYDEVNDRHGINTSNPIVKLEIHDADTPSLGTLLFAGTTIPNDYVGIRAVFNGNNDVDFEIGRKFSSDGSFLAGLTFKGATAKTGFGIDEPVSKVHVQSTNAAVIGFIVQGMAGQGNDLVQFRDFNGDKGSSFDELGNLDLGTTTATLGQMFQGGTRIFHSYGGNLFFGATSGNFTTSGVGSNIAFGQDTLNDITTGSLNSAMGAFALSKLTTGQQNVALGNGSGSRITTGSFNMLIGRNAGSTLTTQGSNVMIGRSVAALIEGTGNTIFGDISCLSMTTGNFNFISGYFAGRNKTGGSYNVILGAFAGQNNDSGSGNVFIGREAGENETGSNLLYIENSDTASPLIYGEFDNDIIRINGTLEAPTDKKHQFRDTAIGIYSQADTFLDLFADGGVRIGNSSGGAPTTYTTMEPDGDTFWTGEGSGLPFGGIFVEGVDVGITLAAQDTYYQVTAWSPGGVGASCEANMTTPDASNDHITILKAGKYLVTFHVSCYSAAKNEYEFEVFVNNGATGYPCTEVYRTTSVASAVGAVSGQSLVDFAANDTVELWVERKDGAAVSKTLTIRQATISVIQVGGT